MKFNVMRTKHNGKENPSFRLVREHGTDDYLFLHFKTPTVFTLFKETRHILPGTCILMPPKTPHSFYPEDCVLIHDWIHFMPYDENEFSKLKIDINTFFVPDDPGFITSSIKKCELELIHKDEFYEEIISSEMTSMLVRLKRQQEKIISGYHADAFRKLRFEIYRDPNHYSDIEVMASAVNLSRSRFTVVYKELFGVPPKNDLINARVSKATYLLSSESLTLDEIATMCGYQNIYHFIRQFRTVTGNTPGAYRKSH